MKSGREGRGFSVLMGGGWHVPCSLPGTEDAQTLGHSLLKTLPPPPAPTPVSVGRQC